MSEPIRVATVKATGRKYIVQSLDMPRSRAGDIIDEQIKVYCWGEVIRYRGLESKHQGIKCFLRSGVDIAEVPKTEWLLKELFIQMLDERRERGTVIVASKSGRTNTIYGNAALILARDAEAKLGGCPSPYKREVIEEAERLVAEGKAEL